MGTDVGGGEGIDVGAGEMVGAAVVGTSVGAFVGVAVGSGKQESMFWSSWGNASAISSVPVKPSSGESQSLRKLAEHDTPEGQHPLKLVAAAVVAVVVAVVVVGLVSL